MLNKKTLDQLSVAASQRVKEKEYWLRKLSGFRQKSRFPLDYTRKSAVEYRLENVSFELSPQLSAMLIKLSAGSDVRLHILLAAGLSALLHRYLGAGGFHETEIDHETGGPGDIVIGCPILKSGNETDFINTLLALRIQVRSQMTFKELLLDVQQTVVEALENCNYPVEILAEQLNKPFSAGDEFPLFDIAMLMENIHDKKLLEDLRLDMIFSFKRENSSLRGCVEYNPSLYDRATIERIKFHFQYLLENAAANPGESISALEFMTLEEKEQLLITFNDTKTGYPAGKTIPGLFAEQAEKNADRIALTLIGVVPYARSVHLTYRELDEKSGRLACLLIEKGVLAGDIVGIKIKRSPEMIIGILGILKAGGAYMPIDPEYPPERIDYMLKDSGTRILINKSEIQNSKYESFGTRLVLNFENLNFDIVSNFEFRASNLVSSNLAYIMYTSGSTGQPKGVMVCHRNVVRLVKNTNFVQLHPETRILQTGAPVFDATTLEIWGSLLNGGQLVLTDKETILDVRRLDKVLKENRINTLWLSSPLFNQLMQQSIELFSTLQYLLVGGDVLAPVNIKRVKQRFPGLNIINGYGPTENTTFSTTYLIEKEFETNIPIGQPIANSTAYIYDQNNRLVPLGAVGELVVGGDGVALGYLNNPELTADKFYRSYRSYKTGIVYKTGDLARWLPDGNIEFLGRIDQQVKIRGFRVELGEIENRLSSHPKVKETLVITREGKAGEEKSLYAYVVPAAPYTVDSLDLAELREYMTGLLPGYMVPAFLTALEKIPLNPNGKIDRRALPEPLRTGSNYIAPRDEIEEKLAQIWAEVLNLGKSAIGIDDDFFELGGHSLKATTLVYRIYKELQVNLEIEKVFTHPTIRELGRQLKGLEELEYDEIETAENEEYYDLSYAQRRLWVLCQFEEDSTAYNIPGAVIVSGPLKTATLARAFQALVDRHESLRTVFISVNGNPRQKILGRLECTLEQIDLRSHGNKAKEEKAREIYREHSNQAFDLENGPLSSFKLVRLDEEQYLVIFNIHHIVSDGWSQGVIYNEVTRLYNAFLKNEENPLPPLQLQYKDYTIWHKQLIETNRFTGSRHFWLEKFKDKPNGIELPLDHSRKPIQTFNGGRVSLTLDNEKTAKLHRLSLEEGATLFMSLLALVNIFLYRYTGQKDIIIGSPIANRKRPELHHMVGFLVNTLIYRNQVDPGKTFRQLLRETRQEALACYRFQDYPFDLLVEQLGLDRDLSQSPLFNVMLAHNNAETEDTALKMEGVTISPYSHSDDFNMSKFDLTFFMDEIAGQVITRIEYNSDLFERSSIERMAANFLCLAEHVLMDVDTPVSRLKYLAQEEYEKVVQRFNDTAYPFSHLTLSELFESRVEKCRDKTAVVHDHHGKIEKISYDDLNKRANQLAHYLANKYRVKPNHIIAVSLERSIDMIVVLWGIIKAGAAYLAVDPTYPRDRVLHVLGDSRSDLLIIDEMRPQLFDNYKGEILNINGMREEIRAGAVENPGIINASSDILYVNYTSGSTGTPNGAMLSHDCLTNLIRWQAEMTAIDCSLRCLQFTSINFCVSFQEIMGTLTSGGELYLIGEVERQDIDYLINFLVKHKIEILFLPFSYLNFLFNESGRWNQSFNHSLKHIITAGEQLKITAGLKRFLDLNPGLRLHNHYGSTEMHVVTSYTLEAATAGRMPVPPAGKPIGNVKIYILDEYYNPVPIGVYGELYVSGSSEVLGYINNEELNSKKLYYHPELSKANGNKRLYRSGDIGRWMADGNIELRGRKDFQVKIRGFRIEPGEIESKILGIENIRECVVVVKEDVSRQKYLVAYISVDNVEISEIKKRIGRDLPQYMIPQLVVLDSLPLMHNGKVDREKLPEPQLKAEGTYTAPRDAVEKTLAAIWAEILNLPQHLVGIDANFFELGGHSLKAVSMINKINKILGVVVPLQEVFHGPTIAEISQVIKNSKVIGFRNIEKQEKKEYYELSYAQKRLWYIGKIEPDSLLFNMPGKVTLYEAFDEKAIRIVLQQLSARHESLRTAFKEINKEPVQVIEPGGQVQINFQVIDISEITGPEQEKQRKELFTTESRHIFNLSQPPLFKITAIVCSTGEYDLVFNMHHIISDGWSMEILKKEFQELHNAYKNSTAPSIESIDLQYIDYAAWQNRLLADEKQMGKAQEFWRKQLSRDLPVLNLPYDFASLSPHSPHSNSKESAGYRWVIPGDLAKRLQFMAEEKKASLFMILLAGFNLLLAKVSCQEDIIIAIPAAARQHEDLKNIIGLFVNTLILCNHVATNEPFLTFFERLQENTLHVLEYQDIPLESICGQLKIKYPEVFVFFNMVNIGSTQQEDVKNLDSFHTGKVQDAKFDIVCYLTEYRNGIEINCHYYKNRFKPLTIEKIMEEYQEILLNMTGNSSGKMSEYFSGGKKRKLKRGGNL